MEQESRKKEAAAAAACNSQSFNNHWPHREARLLAARELARVSNRKFAGA